MHSRGLRACLALVAGFLAACDGGDGGDPPPDPTPDMRVETDSERPPPEMICEAERRRCTDDGVETCVDGTAWQVLGPCPAGTECADGECVEPECEPDCQGRICGSDGCDGVCGECEAGETCNLEGRCDPPPPRCGDDACNGDEDCSTCPADCGNCCGDGTCDDGAGESCTTCPADCACADDEVCNAVTSTCEACQPQCDGRECGADGCGGVCGECADGVDCDAGRCDVPCVPQCDGRACGDDGCEGVCGDCAGGQLCNADGACVDPPAQCGDNVCGGDEDCSTCPADCGNCCGDGECVAGVGEDCSTCPADCGCPDGEACDAEDRRCEPVCVPQCDGRNCGDDGCGGVCGNCVAGQLCEAGVCRDQCQPQCEGRECGGDGCEGNCGECEAGQACNDGTCEVICTPDCEDRQCGDDGCGGFCGNCGVGRFCTEDGQCEDVCTPVCDGRECGDNGCGGDCGGCGPDEECNADGICVEECAPLCAGRECGDDGCGGVCGECPEGAACAPGGICIGAGGCDCADDEVCLDGVCRIPADLCGDDNPVGLCPGGRACLAGQCVDQGAGCSENNQTGACPPGEACRNGVCEQLDASVLCDDDNTCTDDLYDPVRNRCVNVPVAADCSDGNACTADQCVNGECVAEAIEGCVEPPFVEPVQSPTNEGDLTLSGTKPAGASVLINGAEAVPESPEEEWSVELQLQPGENVFEIGTRDMGTESETVTVVVVYDITPPVITVTPDGGIYLDGITITVSTDEPATIYYTDDGGNPTEWSKQFRSIKRIRVFDDTSFRFRARDEAGNWSERLVQSSFEITAEGTGWEAMPALPEARINAAAATTSEGMWLVGGSDGLEPQAGTYRLPIGGAMWMDGPPLPTARSQAALVRDGNALYVIGGQDDGVPLNTVQSLANANAEWADRAPMPTTRFGLGAAQVNNRVYAFGGKTNGGVVLTTAERYTINTNTWDNDIAQLPRARYGFSAVPVGNRIYLIGGEDEEGTPIAEVDIYDIGEDAWVEGVALPTPRSFVGAGVVANIGDVAGGTNELIVAGGRLADGTSTPIVESFVIQDEVWRQRRPLDVPRHGASAAIFQRVDPPVDSEELVLALVGGLVGGGGPVGAGGSADAIAFYAAKDYLRARPPLPEGRFAHAAVELNGLFYVFGGRSFQATDVFWAYDPETGQTVDLPVLPSVQNGLVGVELDGYIYAIGGANQFNNAVPTLRRFEPASGVWTDLRPMISARRDAAAVVVDGEIWVIGGDNNVPQQAVEIYDPASDRWRAGPVLPEGRTGARAVIYEGEIHLISGRRPNGGYDLNVQRLEDGAWVNRFQLPYGIADHQTALVAGRQLFVFGGRNAEAPTNAIASVSMSNGAESRPRDPRTILLPGREMAATISHHGRIYLLGGNVTPEVGPEGIDRVDALISSCFNGVRDGRETVAPGALFDSGGGCPMPDTSIVRDFDLRMRGGTALGQQRLIEMYRSGTWYGICDDGWDDTDATVACRQMFGPGVAGRGVQGGRGPNASFIMDDVRCAGGEANLIDCPYQGLFRHNCGNGEWAQVVCTAN